jgi:NAD(P)-dependent dehydrogenase (short-subunit alcohol dehydrogenase family)
MQTLLVTGGTGNLGQFVLKSLESDYRCVLVPRGEIPKVDEAFGVLHLAGAFAMGSKPDDFTKLVDASLMSAVRVIEAVREKIADGGRIIAISALASLTKPAGMAAYIAAKSALNAYVEVLAKELHKRRITVNALLPSALGPSDVPLDRVVAAIRFLLSEDSASINGQLIAMTA